MPLSHTLHLTLTQCKLNHEGALIIKLNHALGGMI